VARLRPFSSGRPTRSLAARVASVPYDVVDTREARALAAGNRQSFLHVCRPEIDLPEDTDIHAPAVYAKGRENLDRFYADGTLVGDPVPRLLVYRQTWKGRKQDGLVAACSVDDYDTDVIRKHEKTRRDKEDDRVAHLLAQSAHAEPVFRSAGRPRRGLFGRRLRHGRHPQAREDAARQGRRPCCPPARAVRPRRARVQIGRTASSRPVRSTTTTRTSSASTRRRGATRKTTVLPTCSRSPPTPSPCSDRQDGLVAACSVDDYDTDVIRKHEKTRRDKEDDRVAHLLAQSAHAEPVFLPYRATDAISARVGRVTAVPPEFDFEAPDGVRHTLWIVPESDVAFFTAALAAVPLLCVADGHHRSASASRARAALKEKLGSLPDEHPVNWFPAAIFPDRELAILPYNRVVQDLGGRGKEFFLRRVRERFAVRPPEAPEPRRRGQFSLFFEDVWQTLTPREPIAVSDPVASLDVSILQDRLLGPVLGIGDPRTDPRIDFVGGIRGTGELEERVKSGRGALAFAMYPTQISDVMAIADAGVTMPPKSTWFEPKLRSGLFVHRF